MRLLNEFRACYSSVPVDKLGPANSPDLGTFGVRAYQPSPPVIQDITVSGFFGVSGGAAGGHYCATAPNRPTWPNASPDERMIRNWVLYRILSGDIIVEQNVHVIDTCNWIFQAHPVKAAASGSDKNHLDDGDAYTNYSVIFHYANGVSMTFSSTKFDKGWWDVGWKLFGTKGVSEAHYSGPVAICGENSWSWEGANSQAGSGEFSHAGVFHYNLAQADSEKKKSFVDSILSGNYHNQAAQGVESAVSCIMARHAAYTGDEIAYEAVANSDERWNDGIDLNQFA
jgi:myo-inositol 2-dehydrogenase / D-chiro-inositol 1-dehydrogenase